MAVWRIDGFMPFPSELILKVNIMSQIRMRQMIDLVRDLNRSTVSLIDGVHALLQAQRTNPHI